MAHPRRFLVGIALAVAVLAACTPSTTATIPTVATSSAMPSPTPSVTYGPNQTAALAAVTGYYAWWNAARKNPRDPQFKELPKYMDLNAAAYGPTIGDVNALASDGFRQVGDMVPTSMALDPENSAKITVTLCLDRTGTHLENSASATVDPIDAHTGATIPAAQAFTRKSYAIETAVKGTARVITGLTGGTSPC